MCVCLRYGEEEEEEEKLRTAAIGRTAYIYFGYLLHSDTEIQIDTH